MCPVRRFQPSVPQVFKPKDYNLNSLCRDNPRKLEYLIFSRLLAMSDLKISHFHAPILCAFYKYYPSFYVAVFKMLLHLQFLPITIFYSNHVSIIPIISGLSYCNNAFSDTFSNSCKQSVVFPLGVITAPSR